MWPSVAQGALGDFRIGVVAKNPTAVELERMLRGNVAVVRGTFLWSLVQPTRESGYKWERYDDLMTRAALRGQEIFPTIMDSAGFVSEERTHPPTSDRNLRAYDRWVTALVGRYGRDGDFWTDPANAALPYRPLTEWQVWNEPNLPYFWGDETDGREYAQLVKRTSGTIKAVDPRAKVVLAGLVDRDLRDYLDDFYTVSGIKQAFDAAASHPYDPEISSVKAQIKRHRELLDAHGDSGTPLWVTESGWAAGGPRRTLTTSVAGQADRLRDAFGFFYEKRERLRIGTVLWYNWRDVQERDDKNGTWWQHAGLFWEDGRPKPSWEAFVQLTGGDPGTGTIGPGN